MIATSSEFYVSLLRALGGDVTVDEFNGSERRYIVGFDGKNVVMGYESLKVMADVRYRMRMEKVERAAAERKAARAAKRKRR